MLKLLLSAKPESFFGWVWYIFREYQPIFMEGVKYTLIISLIGTIIGLVLAVFITPIKIQVVTKRDHPFVAKLKKLGIFISHSYVEILRGTPMMVQAMIFFYGLANLGFHISPVIAGIIIVSVNTSAYIIEVLRGSIEAIDKGQMEAARSLGMTRWQAMIQIIIPQAFKNSIPAIGNEFVINIKDTSVLSVIQIRELYFMANTISGRDYRYVETFMIAAILYFIMTFITTRLLYWITKKIDRNKKTSYPTSQSMPRLLKNKEVSL